MWTDGRHNHNFCYISFPLKNLLMNIPFSKVLDVLIVVNLIYQQR